MSLSFPLSTAQTEEWQNSRQILWQKSGHALTEQDAQSLADILRSNTRLEELRLHIPMEEAAASLLADAVRTHPSLRYFHLQQPDISPQAQRRLSAAALALPQLEVLQIREADMPSFLLEDICTQAAQHPSLHSICLSKNSIDTAQSETIATMLAQKNNWQRIRLMDCELGDEAMRRIAGGLGEQPHLTRLHLQHNPAANGGNILEQAVLAGDFRNLLSVFPATPATQALCRSNQNSAQKLLDDTAPALAEEKILPMRINMELSERLSALKAISNGDARYAVCAAYLEEIPALHRDSGLSFTQQLLAAGNRHGQSAAENPQTWAECETLLQILEAEGTAIDGDWLRQTTAQGESLLLCGLAGGGGDFIRALNQRGITLQEEWLLQADGSASAALETAWLRGESAALFIRKNWENGHPDALRQVMAAIPETERPQTGNYHQLLTLLQQQQQASQRGYGMAR